MNNQKVSCTQHNQKLYHSYLKTIAALPERVRPLLDPCLNQLIEDMKLKHPQGTLLFRTIKHKKCCVSIWTQPATKSIYISAHMEKAAGAKKKKTSAYKITPFAAFPVTKVTKVAKVAFTIDRDYKDQAYRIITKVNTFFRETGNRKKGIIRRHAQCIYQNKKGNTKWVQFLEHGEMTLADKWKLDTTLESRLPHFSELLAGIKSMHDLGWVHADLKLTNVVTSEETKVIDFDTACKSGHVPKGHLVCSHLMCPPEYALHFLGYSLKNQPPCQWGKEIDIWSLGVILFKLITNVYPEVSQGLNCLLRLREEMNTLKENIEDTETQNQLEEKQKQFDELLQKLPQELEKLSMLKMQKHPMLKLTSKMLDLDPLKRPSIDEVIKEFEMLKELLI